MTKEEFLRLSTALPATRQDSPFEEDFDSVVVRHTDNNRWFALLMTLNGRQIVNLKCDPQKAMFWRDSYPDVIPAWHMNKTHWNTLFLDGAVPEEDIREMVADSYALTAGGKKAAPRKKRGAGKKIPKGGV